MTTTNTAATLATPHTVKCLKEGRNALANAVKLLNAASVEMSAAMNLLTLAGSPVVTDVAGQRDGTLWTAECLGMFVQSLDASIAAATTIQPMPNTILPTGHVVPTPAPVAEKPASVPTPAPVAEKPAPTTYAIFAALKPGQMTLPECYVQHGTSALKQHLESKTAAQLDDTLAMYGISKGKKPSQSIAALVKFAVAHVGHTPILTHTPSVAAQTVVPPVTPVAEKPAPVAIPEGPLTYKQLTGMGKDSVLEVARKHGMAVDTTVKGWFLKACKALATAEKPVEKLIVKSGSTERDATVADVAAWLAAKLGIKATDLDAAIALATGK